MQWEGREESSNVEDRRGMSPGLMIGGGGGILVAIIAFFLGVDPGNFLGGGGGQKGGPEEDRMQKFSSVVFRDTEKVWDEQFTKMGKKYKHPTLVFYTGQTNTGCGAADSGVGPFYCPADSKVYLGSFVLRASRQETGRSWQSSLAYVIAHEVGHHVQRLWGIPSKTFGERVPRSISTARRFAWSCRPITSPVFGHTTHRRISTTLDDNDLKSAENAAYNIGDDHLQKKPGRVQPDSFTHGTSEQRRAGSWRASARATWAERSNCSTSLTTGSESISATFSGLSCLLSRLPGDFNASRAMHSEPVHLVRVRDRCRG